MTADGSGSGAASPSQAQYRFACACARCSEPLAPPPATSTSTNAAAPAPAAGDLPLDAALTAAGRCAACGAGWLLRAGGASGARTCSACGQGAHPGTLAAVAAAEGRLHSAVEAARLAMQARTRNSTFDSLFLVISTLGHLSTSSLRRNLLPIRRSAARAQRNGRHVRCGRPGVRAAVRAGARAAGRRRRDRGADARARH